MNAKDIDNLIALGRLITAKRFTDRKLKRRCKDIPPHEISKELLQKIKQTWGDVPVNPKWIDVYNTNCDIKPENPEYFLPDNLYFGAVDLFYNNYAACRDLDNKNLYDLLFHDLNRPTTVIRKINGTFMDAAYRMIDFDEAQKRIAQTGGGVILKPSVLSCGGRNITICREGEPTDNIAAALSEWGNLIVQRLIVQHPSMSYLHANSVNTVRMMVWVRACGEVELLNAIVRMGVGNSVVDNATAGGIFCGIDADGRLKPHAFNTKGILFERHPDGAEFTNVTIPNYAELVALAKHLALRIANVSRLSSWDFAIGEDGLPIFIEVNLAYGGMDVHQITNGPLFGKHTPEMIAEVFSSKRFRRYSKFLNL